MKLFIRPTLHIINEKKHREGEEKQKAWATNWINNNVCLRRALGAIISIWEGRNLRNRETWADPSLKCWEPRELRSLNSAVCKKNDSVTIKNCWTISIVATKSTTERQRHQDRKTKAVTHSRYYTEWYDTRNVRMEVQQKNLWDRAL